MDSDHLTAINVRLLINDAASRLTCLKQILVCFQKMRNFVSMHVINLTPACIDFVLISTVGRFSSVEVLVDLLLVMYLQGTIVWLGTVLFKALDSW